MPHANCVSLCKKVIIIRKGLVKKYGEKGRGKGGRGGCGPEQKGNGSSVFEHLARGGSFDCQQPIGGGHPILNRNRHIVK